MNYEQKYNEALERAKKLYEKGTITESINYIFPELKESEDERIRKAIKKALRVKCCDYKYSHRIISDESVTLEEAVDWLEKQSEKEFVYIVTRCEEHSDYVEKAFLDKEAAEAYCKQFNEDEDSYRRHITKVKID